MRLADVFSDPEKQLTEGRDCLPLGVLSVCDSVTDDGLKERLENTTGLLVDHGGDTLDTTTASETADGWLGYALDVVTQDFSVAFGSSLAQTLRKLATVTGVGDKSLPFPPFPLPVMMK
jgi:hypothetical protein